MNIASFRAALLAALAVAAVIAGGFAFTPPAAADLTYNPPAGTYNGYIIYLSRACHDGNDGVPGGPCITNTGCAGYSENANSNSVTSSATTNLGSGGTNAGLIHRGYRVIIGTGTLSQNVANSNAAGADVHVPVHSNAQGSGSCGGSTSASNNGTWGLYGAYSACATRLRYDVGPSSPGTADKIVKRTDLGEINNTTAVACYLESEFHTWTTGKNWLNNYTSWAWRIGMAIDTYLGYP